MTNFNKVKEFFAPGAFQFILAGIFATSALLWGSLDLPGVGAIVTTAEMLFERYGLIALFIAAFIESIFMISFYFPGSAVVVLAILVSDRSPSSLAVIVVIGWASVLAASAVNYWLGKEGFYRLLLRIGSPSTVEKMQAWLDKRGFFALFLSAMHPNFLAIANICMGITRKGLLKTLMFSFLAILFWIPLQVYILGFVLPDPQESGLLLYLLVIIGLLLWGGLLVAKEYRTNSNRTLAN